MRVALACALPFHRWVLSPLDAALRGRGHETVWCVHRPSHAHDWATGSGGGEFRAALVSAEPDLVVAADYPYGALRDWTDAPVLAVRHSLASRWNTWAPEQAEADWVATWSRYDEERFGRLGVAPRGGFLRAGCTFVAPLATLDRARCCREVRESLGARGDARLVLWCPTWNADLSCRSTVLRELAQLRRSGWAVLVRVHAASAWREPDFVEELREQRMAVEADPDLGPWTAILAADVVVSDVSGAGLLPLAVPDVTVPVVWVDPPTDVLDGHSWHDPDGPEWMLRYLIGPKARSGDGIAALIERVAVLDRYREGRSIARAVLFDDLIETDPCVRLACMVESAVVGSAS